MGKAGACKALCPQHMLAPYYGQYCKCQNSTNLFGICLSQSGNLLIIPYQLNKCQAPSSNSFRYILLTSLKWPNFQRAITPENIDGIRSKANQAIPYQLTKLQVPGSNKSSCQDILLLCLKCPNLWKATTPENIDGIRSKLNQVIYSTSSIDRVSSP